MTKLEEKLIELGYENVYGYVYIKRLNSIYSISFEVYSSVYYCSTYREIKSFRKQQDIDDLQQAFNTMQKDLEVLKECEK